MMGRVAVFVMCFITYIIFVGSVSTYDLLTGALVSIIVTALTAKYLIRDEGKLAQVWRLAYLVKYIAIFIKMEVISHIEVIKTIISGKVNPSILEIPYDLRSDYAVTLTACSITNTPGTLVVDLDPGRKAYYVHWLNTKTLKTVEARDQISKPFEEVSKKVFD